MIRLNRAVVIAAAVCLSVSALSLNKVLSAAPSNAHLKFAINARWHDPYVGDWSNGRGDTLVIATETMKFDGEKTPYRDITRVTNGREFNLQITAEGKLNYLTEFLHISFGDGDKTDEMKITLYNSRKDMEAGANSQGEATWDRDK